MDYLPGSAAELIEELNTLFPHRCIEPNETPEEAHRYAGKRELVEYLQEMLRQTEENALKDGLEA